MVDFALAAEREEGKNSRDAIFQACLLRFRPILMTTMAAIFGALPLVLSNGTGSELRRPLGITIVGGLIMSQVLTLYTTPVVYLYLDRLSLWWNRMHKRKLAGWLRRRHSDDRADEIFNENHEPTAQNGNQDDAGCACVPGSVCRMQLRAEICETVRPNARGFQGIDAGAIQGNRRLENRRAKGRRDSRPMVGNVCRHKFERARSAGEHFQSNGRGGVRKFSVGAGRGETIALAILSNRDGQPVHHRVRQGAVRSGSFATGSPFTLTDYALPADASWELDFWGSIRNTYQGKQIRSAGDAGRFGKHTADGSIRTGGGLFYASLAGFAESNFWIPPSTLTGIRLR